MLPTVETYSIDERCLQLGEFSSRQVEPLEHVWKMVDRLNATLGREMALILSAGPKDGIARRLLREDRSFVLVIELTVDPSMWMCRLKFLLLFDAPLAFLLNLHRQPEHLM